MRTQICVSVTEDTTAGVVARLEELSGTADLIEVRGDLVRDLDLLAILRAKTEPVLFTCRSVSEGGRADDAAPGPGGRCCSRPCAAGSTTSTRSTGAASRAVCQSVENPWVYVDTNITGTLNMVELCLRYGIPKLVLASTSSIYGANAPLPTPEVADSNYPLQPYAASKKGAETLCHSYHFLYNLDITIFRYFTVYGPAGRPDMSMFRFAKWITEGETVRVNGDGEQSRGFTYIDDIARGTILGLKPLGYEIINLGGHETIRLNQVIELIEELTHKKAKVEHLPLNPADMLAYWANIDKAKRLLGWEPEVSLVDGVTRLVDWYNAERSWACQIQTG